MICEKCGSVVEEGQRFCGVCGSVVNWNQTPAPAPAPEEVPQVEVAEQPAQEAPVAEEPAAPTTQLRTGVYGEPVAADPGATTVLSMDMLTAGYGQAAPAEPVAPAPAPAPIPQPVAPAPTPVPVPQPVAPAPAPALNIPTPGVTPKPVMAQMNIVNPGMPVSNSTAPKAPAPIAQPTAPAGVKPIGAWSYIGWNLLFHCPVWIGLFLTTKVGNPWMLLSCLTGFVIAIIVACAAKNPVTKKYALSHVIGYIIVMIICIILFAVVSLFWEDILAMLMGEIYTNAMSSAVPYLLGGF